MRMVEREAIAKATRGSFVIGAYRWLIEVALLFAAFNEFPDHKWSIGLALLAFNGGVRAIVHIMAGLQATAGPNDFRNQRKILHAIALAAEHANVGESKLTQEAFLDEVHARVEQEYASVDEVAGKPTPRWIGFLLATGALIWEMSASLLGIGLVVSLTS